MRTAQSTMASDNRRMMKICILISANTEWKVVLDLLGISRVQSSSLGDWFTLDVKLNDRVEPVMFFHGGWGKVAAAASTQYVLDTWSPVLLVNLGTCGGFAGKVGKSEIVLAERTLIYDIVEQMGDAGEAIAHYTTEIDLSWLGMDYPHPVHRTLLISADRDIVAADTEGLIRQYDAIAADWESGAIAWVAARAGVRCLILRGVTDLVSSDSGEAYAGNSHVFVEGTRSVMSRLLDALPQWLHLAATVP